jgi:hypothetical protein
MTVTTIMTNFVLLSNFRKTLWMAGCFDEKNSLKIAKTYLESL